MAKTLQKTAAEKLEEMFAVDGVKSGFQMLDSGELRIISNNLDLIKKLGRNLTQHEGFEIISEASRSTAENPMEITQWQVKGERHYSIALRHDDEKIQSKLENILGELQENKILRKVKGFPTGLQNQNNLDVDFSVVEEGHKQELDAAIENSEINRLIASAIENSTPSDVAPPHKVRGSEQAESRAVKLARFARGEGFDDEKDEFFAAAAEAATSPQEPVTLASKVNLQDPLLPKFRPPTPATKREQEKSYLAAVLTAAVLMIGTFGGLMGLRQVAASREAEKPAVVQMKEKSLLNEIKEKITENYHRVTGLKKEIPRKDLDDAAKLVYHTLQYPNDTKMTIMSKMEYHDAIKETYEEMQKNKKFIFAKSEPSR